MHYAIDAAKGAGLRSPRLYINEMKMIICIVYEHFGFVVEDRRHEAGYDRVYLIKALV